MPRQINNRPRRRRALQLLIALALLCSSQAFALPLERIETLCLADRHCSSTLDRYLKSWSSQPEEIRAAAAEAELHWLNNGWDQAAQVFIAGGLPAVEAYALVLQGRIGDMEMTAAIAKGRSKGNVPPPASASAPPKSSEPRPENVPPKPEHLSENDPGKSEAVPLSPEEACLADSDCARSMQKYIEALLTFPPKQQQEVMEEEALWRAKDWAAESRLYISAGWPPTKVYDDVLKLRTEMLRERSQTASMGAGNSSGYVPSTGAAPSTGQTVPPSGEEGLVFFLVIVIVIGGLIFCWKISSRLVDGAEKVADKALKKFLDW